MEPKKMMGLLAIMVVSLFAVIIGGSYAWYAYDNAKTEASGSTASENPTVIFSQNDRLFYKDIMPIYDEDRYNYAGRNSFSVTIGENLIGYSSGIEISLADISLADELKIGNFKYELLENNSVIASGNFSTIGNEKTIILKPMTTLNVTSYPTTYNYDFYVWLMEDGSNQNDLMNKTFSARINVESAVKK